MRPSRSLMQKPRGKKKNPKGGRPRFEPTSEQRGIVESMAFAGVPHDIIRLRIVNPQTGNPINRATLTQAFGEELAIYPHERVAAVAESITRQALKGNVRACMFILERRGGEVWQKHEHQSLTATLTIADAIREAEQPGDE